MSLETKLGVGVVVVVLVIIGLALRDQYRIAHCPPDKLVAYEATSCYTVMVGVAPYQTPITNCTPYTAHRCEVE